MLVYRIECEKYHGPYKRPNGVQCETYGISGWASKRQPLPASDFSGDKKYPENHRYGFRDLRQLRNWFLKEEREALGKNGFVCRVYKVPKKRVVMGKKQLVFSADHAKFVRESRTIKRA